MVKRIYSIHPAIGIARLGKSALVDKDGVPTKESYFIGPESPGFEFSPSAYDGTSTGDGAGLYRDSKKHIRRQGARFRVYEKEVDEFSGRVLSVREITSKEAEIGWKVSLANKKAAGPRFPLYHRDNLIAMDPELVMRNPRFKGNDRERLIIKDEGSVSLGGHAKLSGEFLEQDVTIADLLTDDVGRLIVLGGHGDGINPKNKELFEPPIGGRHRLYNNDWWADDTSDGRITATLTFKGASAKVDVDEAAWVLVAPPNHAPAVQSAITLYDLVWQASLAHRPALAEPSEVSFTRDIYPLLRRAVELQWVSEFARMGHGEHDPGNFLEPEHLKVFANNSAAHQWTRSYFVNRLTQPGATGDRIDMPDLFGGVDPLDPYKEPRKVPGTNELVPLPNRDRFGIPLMVTEYQRVVFESWAAGRFVSDWDGEPCYPSIDSIAPAEQPAALDEAALEHGAGGSFHPGIEGSFVMARPDTYDDWFRVSDSKEPGDLTQHLAVPWHIDFGACDDLWWPGQRPNSVAVGNRNQFARWFRGMAPPTSLANLKRWITEMLELGFVKRNADGDILEDERELPEQKSFRATLVPENFEDAENTRQLLQRLRDEVEFE